jgi:hypothetical protein
MKKKKGGGGTISVVKALCPLEYRAVLSAESKPTYRIGGTCYLHLQGRRVSQARNQH